MAQLIQPKQIQKVQIAPIIISNKSVTGSSVIVTTDISGALNNAGANLSSVPFQVSSGEGVIGIVASGSNQKCSVFSNLSSDSIYDSNGGQVYGKLTQASSIYTLSFFSVVAGVETAYSFGTATAINFAFNYRFSWATYPEDAAVKLKQYNVDDPESVVAKVQRDNLVIATQNTVPNLSKTPATYVDFYINGQCYSTLNTNVFTVAGLVVTFSSANAGFTLDVTDTVFARYETYS